MNEQLISALNAIPVSALTYQEWINIGFALKKEGMPCEVWDNWSRPDSRYHEGECRHKWETFQGSSNPITGATIFQIAQKYGYKGFSGDGILDWNDFIEFDGIQEDSAYSPTEDFRTYLKTLFKEDEYVGYVTQSILKEDGKYCPANAGCFDRTAGELLRQLDKYPSDLGAVLGDWNPEAGAWIRFNALDGKGCKNTNVTSFRYALVESDSMDLYEQAQMYEKLNLPIAVLVSSGAKSLHAIVKVDALNLEQYKERVAYLYGYLKEHGLEVDTQNSNPSRLSRLPGATRGTNVQKIEALNIGSRSWDAWTSYIASCSDDMPAVVSLEDYRDNRPKLPEPLIDGILRCGHKMLISGSSKAGKSFLLMELAISLAEGRPWLGFYVRQGKVLYVNLEIDHSSCINRFYDIYDALGLKERKNLSNISIWNLRGKAIPLDKLVPKIVKVVVGKGYEAVIIDPIYKVITGDENSASDMGAFCNQFDKICDETGCSAIYCHHHSKGAQGYKRVIDRASGSGVFARDPDAQLDIIELELSEDMKNNVRDGDATAWRMEGSLREFKNFKPVNFWFEHPIHRLDSQLKDTPAEGSKEANLAKSPKRTTSDDRYATVLTAFENTVENGVSSAHDMAEYAGVSERSIKRYLEEFDDEFDTKKGLVTRKN